MIIVMDSNIWVTLAINRQLEFIDQLKKFNITIASCQILTDELADVLRRPKLKRYVTNEYVERFFQFYQLTSSTFQIGKIEEIVTDQKDNFLFSLCKTTGAAYLITGDKLLLQVEKYLSTSVVTLINFKDIFQTL